MVGRSVASVCTLPRRLTTPMPLATRPNTVCLPSKKGVGASVTKNCGSSSSSHPCAHQRRQSSTLCLCMEVRQPACRLASLWCCCCKGDAAAAAKLLQVRNSNCNAAHSHAHVHTKAPQMLPATRPAAHTAARPAHLAAVGVAARVGHAEDACPGVPQLRVDLVLKLCGRKKCSCSRRVRMRREPLQYLPVKIADLMCSVHSIREVRFMCCCVRAADISACCQRGHHVR